MSQHRLNSLCKNSIPFLFITDFLAQRVECYKLDELADLGIEFCLKADPTTPHNIVIKKTGSNLSTYRDKFEQIQEQIRCGNTYLLNLTQSTKIELKETLKEVYDNANAPYKLKYKDEFVCFSPEKFIQIKGDRIYTYPMKGTIDASIHNATELILSDKKELAEHVMVVDLLRNDLGLVATDVRVERFRYIERIEAGGKELLQVSSKISAQLPKNWRQNFGEILKKLLPAGSISGAPKKSTVSIIERVEGYKRGFYTGVFGLFDGKNITSAVMIRFIQKDGSTVVYKSGGGITIDSRCEDEYQELMDKIYVP